MRPVSCLVAQALCFFQSALRTGLLENLLLGHNRAVIAASGHRLTSRVGVLVGGIEPVTRLGRFVEAREEARPAGLVILVTKVSVALALCQALLLVLLVLVLLRLLLRLVGRRLLVIGVVDGRGDRRVLRLVLRRLLHEVGYVHRLTAGLGLVRSESEGRSRACWRSDLESFSRARVLLQLPLPLLAGRGHALGQLQRLRCEFAPHGVRQLRPRPLPLPLPVLPGGRLGCGRRQACRAGSSGSCRRGRDRRGLSRRAAPTV